MAKVCVLVFNSVLHDARVLKEADTLSVAGHDVTIVGFGDKRAEPGEYARPSGVGIHLLDTQGIWSGPGHASFSGRGLSLFMKLDAFVNRVGRSLTNRARKIWSNKVRFALRLTRNVVMILFSVTGGFALVHIDRNDLIVNLEGGVWIAILAILAALKVVRILDRLQSKLEREWRRRRELAEAEANPVEKSPGVFSRFSQGFWRAKANMVRSLKITLGNRIKLWMMVDAARALHPDIIHCHDLATLPVGHRARRGRAIKVIWDAHEIYEEVAQGDAEHRERNRRLLRDNCSGVDGFVTINDSIANFYREKYPSLPAATIVKNATVPIEPVTYDGRLHAAAALPLEQSVVLYQGGFAEKRGLRDLVAAARYLDSRWTLVMMGWGRIEGELKAVGNEVNGARADRAYPAVVFIPAAPQAELPMWTAGALVGLIPYERTGLNHLYCTPNKLWEYPNANVPILCSPLVEMTKVIEENGVGWLLPETSTPEAIAEVINGLSDEDLTRAREACASYIARDNWSTYEGALLGLYERILAREAA